jgi:ABC-type transport system involved in multi-copper enzyme maturation permease subunit
MVYVIKILVSIAIMFVSIGISIIVCLFSMLLPSAKGDIGLYPNLIVSLILEATLCILVFNLLAIIISFFLNPTRILTFTMTIAVVFIVYNAFSPTFYKSTTDRIISNSSEPIQNFQYVAPNGDILNTYNINDKNTNFKDV